MRASGAETVGMRRHGRGWSLSSHLRKTQSRLWKTRCVEKIWSYRLICHPETVEVAKVQR